MSQQNVEIVRRAFQAAFCKPPDFDTMDALYRPDHAFVSLIQRIEGGVAEGGRGYRDWLAENDESWERWDVELEQVRSIDGDRVLVDSTFTGISKRGRVPVKQSSTAIVTVRDRKIARTELYSSAEQALEAAGLSE